MMTNSGNNLKGASEPIRLLYIDDNGDHRELVRNCLEQTPGRYVMTEAATFEEFERRLDDGQFDIVLTDFNILGFEGLDVLDAVKSRSPDTPVVILTGTGSEEVAVESLKRGAGDYVIKTTRHIKRLPVTLEGALEKAHLERAQKEAIEDLRRHKEQIEQIIYRNADGMLVLDRDGIILFANAAAATLLNRDPDRLVGASFGVPIVVHESIEIEIPHVDLPASCVELRASTLEWQGRDATLAVLRDITQRRRQEKQIKHLSRVQRAIRNINQLTVRERDPEKLIQKACDKLVGVRKYSGAWIALGISPVTALAHSGLGNEEELLPFLELLREEAGLDSHSEKSSNALSLAEEGPGAVLAQYYGANKAVVTPLRHGDTTHGLLGVSFSVELDVNEDEESLLEELAEDLAFTLEDIQNERARAQAEEETSALLEANKAVIESEDFETAAKRIFEICKAQTGATAGYVALRKGENENGVLFLDSGGAECGVDPSLPMPIRGLRAEAYRENRTVFDNSFPTSPHVAFLPEGHAPLHNVMFVPISIEGDVKGIIGLANKVGAFDEGDARRAQSLGEVAAIALERSLHIEALADRERLLARITDNMSDMVALADLEGKLTYASPSHRQLGYDPESLIGRPGAEFIHEDDIPAIMEKLDRVRRFSEEQNGEYRFKRSDGTYCWLESIAKLLTNGDGTPAGFIYSTRDVSPRKKAEQELAASEKRFRALFENTLAPIAVTDDDGRFLDVNAAFCELFGYARDRLLSMKVSDLVSITEKSSGQQFLEYKETRGSQGDFSFARADGQERVALWSAAEIEDGQHATVLQDITDLKRYEQTLRQEKERAQRYLDVAAVVLLGLDSSGRINLLNRRGCEVLGLVNEESALGKDWIDFVPIEKREEVSDIFRAIMAGEVDAHRRSENPIQTTAGETRTIVWHNAVLKDGNGGIIGTLSSGEDVTDRRQMEAQLAQADRLSSMGMLAAGVAHEINNPLSYILYNLQSLSDDLPQLVDACRELQANAVEHKAPLGLTGELERLSTALNPLVFEDIMQRFKDALEGTQRIRDIARGLGTFSRVERDRLVPVNLTPCIEAAINMAFNEIKYRARLVKEYGKVPTIMASEGRLSQVFLNLIINATHAMDEGSVDDNEIRVRTWSEGDAVFAEVKDTGMGIPPQNLPKLFEPFFTTKQIGVGSGLGLAISKNIVESYGGTIEVESEVGRGTSFTIQIPIQSPEVAQATTAPRRETKGTKVGGRVLIVDDEAGIRTAMVRMLRAHETVEAASGSEAKKILEEDSNFDLILCDMMMPDVSGMDLHQWLAESHPHLAKQFVFITGGAFTPRARDYLGKVENIRLEKPFDPDNFAKIVDNFVESGKGAKKTFGS